MTNKISNKMSVSEAVVANWSKRGLKGKIFMVSLGIVSSPLTIAGGVLYGVYKTISWAGEKLDRALNNLISNPKPLTDRTDLWQQESNEAARRERY